MAEHSPEHTPQNPAAEKLPPKEHALLEHRDLEIRLDARLATKLLAALEFPLRIEFPEDELEQEPLEVSEAHTPEASYEIHEDGIEAIVEDVLVQPLVDHLDKTHVDPAKAAKAAEGSDDPKADEAAGDAEALADVAEEAAEEAKDES